MNIADIERKLELGIADFYISYSKRLVYSVMSEHYHNYYEIFYFLGNNMNYFIDKNLYKVNKFDMLFIESNVYHKSIYSDNSPRDRILINFNLPALRSIADKAILDKVINLFKVKKLSFTNETNVKIAEILFNQIIPCYKENTDISLLKAKILFNNFLLILLEEMDKGNAINVPLDLSGKEIRIAEIISYINLNYMNRITLDSLCKEFFIDKYYLCHTFKDIVGISIMDYITNKRLSEAEKMLRFSNSSITQISSTVGFSDCNRFIQVFRKKYQITPKHYRTKINSYTV